MISWDNIQVLPHQTVSEGSSSLSIHPLWSEHSLQGRKNQTQLQTVEAFKRDRIWSLGCFFCAKYNYFPNSLFYSKKIKNKTNQNSAEFNPLCIAVWSEGGCLLLTVPVKTKGKNVQRVQEKEGEVCELYFS